MNEHYTDDDGEVRELDDAFFRKAARGRPPLPDDLKKVRTTVLLDPDVVEALKGEHPKGWQTRLNATLREALGL